MKKVFTIVAVLAVISFPAIAQMEKVKQRAKDLSNQNNVRQGVPPPAQSAPKPVHPAAPVAAAPSPVPLQTTNIAKIQRDIAAIKPGKTAAAEQQQQLTADVAASARGAKPNLATVKKFTDSLTLILPTADLKPEHQARLSQNIEAVLNSKALPASQFDAIIADVQAILEVGGVRKGIAAAVGSDLKSIGAEIRR